MLWQLRSNLRRGCCQRPPPTGLTAGLRAEPLEWRLEAAARLQRVVVLRGSAGTGKTELAKAFGRWWRDTGGVEQQEWVFWHSFEPGVASFALEGVISEIGLGVYGPDFAALDSGDRRKLVQKLLEEHRLLLIWDNFETVRTMPDSTAATPPLGQQGCQELKDFLKRVASRGRSAVIITSRASEDWLGGIRHLAVGGLASHEAAEYAGGLLAPYPAALPRRAKRAFGELMQWLDGHPLSMRLVLPYLNRTEAKELLNGLKGLVALPSENDEDGRTASLTSSIRYSYSHLSSTQRRLLAALCLLQGIAVATTLTIFSQAISGVPIRFHGATAKHWLSALDAAARIGLLTRLDHGIYQIHPALPAYLAAEWQRQARNSYDRERGDAFRALLAAHAGLGDWLHEQIASGDAGLAYTLISLQQRTMGSLLGYALDHQLYELAQAIAQPLNAYWEARGFFEEADAWVDRVRLATEKPDGAAPPLDTPAGGLWLFFIGQQADRQAKSRHLDQADQTYQQILASLQTQPASPHRDASLAVTYHTFGNVAYERGRLGEAEDWCTKALAIDEELGDRSKMAGSYHNLGVVAQDRGQLEEAEDWYTKALAIFEDIGNRTAMATSYHQLGGVAQDRGRLEEAEDWYTKALTIFEEVGNRPDMARAYHNLGIITQDQGRLEEAEDWYTKALAIFEEVGNRADMAKTHAGISLLAERKGQRHRASD
jgi:tetratricopeptide (TPR) repeat protein